MWPSADAIMPPQLLPLQKQEQEQQHGEELVPARPSRAVMYALVSLQGLPNWVIRNGSELAACCLSVICRHSAVCSFVVVCGTDWYSDHRAYPLQTAVPQPRPGSRSWLRTWDSAARTEHCCSHRGILATWFHRSPVQR